VFLFIFEGLGTSELIMILIVALVLFGPRKLPQLSRKLGKSLGDFKRASEDFKQTWEREVERESAIKEALVGEAMLPEDRSILGESRSRSEAVLNESESLARDNGAPPTPEQMNADEAAARTHTAADTSSPPPRASESSPTRKRDWL
jgi:sec-independent protein translocase protein TatB